MDLFQKLTEITPTTERIQIRKVYINEDPSKEETMPCPKCWSENHYNNIRYMFLNMNEAIFKCESTSCMYPFRNFKFKNYTDNTVYYYTHVPKDEFHVPEKLNDEKMVKCEDNVPGPSTVLDFNFDLLSPERVSLPELSISDPNIFGSPSLSFKSLVKDFDTGFIDDILHELTQNSCKSPTVKQQVPVTPPKKCSITTSNRQLKKCLQMFQDKKLIPKRTDGVFKIPPLPGSDITSHARSKSSKNTIKRHRHIRQRQHRTPMSSEKLLEQNRVRPLEFIEELNHIQQTEVSRKDTQLEAAPVSGIHRLGNEKVERMLNFIERSMKNRDSVADTNNSAADKIAKRLAPEQNSNRRRKDYKKLSLSAAVLHDSDFEYSTSETEDESTDCSSSNSSDSICLDTKMCDQQIENPEMSLPSFNQLVGSIQSKHPTGNEVLPVKPRSAGSSPTYSHWDESPPRKIHSMSSLSSLLD